MFVTDDEKTLPDVVYTSRQPGANTATLADKARDSGPKQRVHPFHPTGSAVCLVRDAVLPGREKRAIHRVPIRVDQLRAVGGRHECPQRFQHRPTSVANHRRHDLSGLSRTGHPEPKTALFADAHLVYLKRIAPGGVQNRLLPLVGYTLCPFLRTAATVVRLTLSRRAIPRCERRSAKARCIWTSFSGVTERSIGAGVKVFLQALQRQRAVPERFRPKRTTRSVS